MLAIIAFLPALTLSAAASTPCPTHAQPMPPAVEAIGEPAAASSVIVFAATPWEVPGRAWVVRLSHRGTVAALEIVRLRRRSECNIYDVERRWNAAIGTEDYRSVAQAIGPWATLPGGFPVNEGSADLALDGTQLELRVTANGWAVTRTQNHYGGTGPRLSAIFRTLVSRHVPAAELPAEDWRTRRAPLSPRPAD